MNNKQIFLRASDQKRVAGFRGKFEVSTGMVMDIETTKVKQLLVPGDGVVYPGQTGLGNLVGLSPNGRYAYMPAFYGDPMMIMGKWEKPSRALLKVRLDGAGKPRRYQSGTRDTVNFFVGTEGNVIAREDFEESDNLHKVFARHGKKWVEIFSEETDYRYRSFVGITQDEKHLVMLDTSDETGRTAFYKMALSDGSIQGPLHNRVDADIVGVTSDIQRIVHGVIYSGLTPSYKFFDSKLDARVKAIQANFPDHNVRIADSSSDWKHIVVLVEGTQAPGDYYLFSENKDPQFLATRRPNIRVEDMNPLGTVTITARDGLNIPTIITIPRNKVADMKNLPAVLMPHGGPASYDEIGFNYTAQALAQQSYMVIMPQFRGSSGLGRDHEIAGHGEWGRKMQDDLTDAMNFFIKKGIVDPERIAIVGGSYGGYAALAGGAFTPDLYKCVVSINGIGDLAQFRSWIRGERGRSSESLAYWETQIGGQEYTKEEAISRSPARVADNFQAPVLLIHSVDDEIVPIGQSKIMARALKKAGKDVELIQLKGDDHHLSFGKTRLEALKATVEFIREHI